jgi:hypothetical protein
MVQPGITKTCCTLHVVLRTLADGRTGLQPVHPFNHDVSRNDYDV